MEFLTGKFVQMVSKVLISILIVLWIEFKTYWREIYGHKFQKHRFNAVDLSIETKIILKIGGGGRIIAFDEGERILILPLLAGSGLMLSCFENFRTGDRLKMFKWIATQ